MTECQRVFIIRVQLKFRDSSLNRSNSDRKIDSCETMPCSECRKIERGGHVPVISCQVQLAVNSGHLALLARLEMLHKAFHPLSVASLSILYPHDDIIHSYFLPLFFKHKISNSI